MIFKSSLRRRLLHGWQNTFDIIVSGKLSEIHRALMLCSIVRVRPELRTEHFAGSDSTEQYKGNSSVVIQWRERKSL